MRNMGSGRREGDRRAEQTASICTRNGLVLVGRAASERVPRERTPQEKAAWILVATQLPGHDESSQENKQREWNLEGVDLRES